MRSVLANVYSPALVLCLLALGSARPGPAIAAQGAAVHVQADRRPIPELVAEVRRLGDETPTATFDELAGHRSARALTELKKCAKLLESDFALARLYGSLRLLKEDPALCDKAAAWLAKVCKSKGVERRTAAVALGRLGTAASKHAERLCRRDVPRWIGSAALPAVLDRMDVQSKNGDLELVLQYYSIGVSGTELRFLEVLSRFDKKSDLKLLGDYVGDPAGRGATKTAIVGVLEASATPDALRLLHDLLARPLNAPVVEIVGALRRLEYVEHATDLERLTRNQSMEIEAAAYVGRIQVGDDGMKWFERLEGLLEDDDEARRLVGIEGCKALALLGTPPEAISRCIEGLVVMLADPSVRVSHAAVASILELRRPDLVSKLFTLLETDDLKERARIQEVLELLTGADLGASAARWAAWWEKEGKSLPLPSLDVATERRQERARRRNKARRTTFYGMRITGDNICFLIDASGSMATVNYWGESRLDIAKQETVGALKRLRDGTSFNLVFFGTTTDPWSAQLVVMDAETRERAIDFVNAQEFLGGTAIYDALEGVFADERVEQIYILSDGEPAGGTIDDPRRIILEVQKWNKRRRLAMHCISIGFRSEFLAELADVSGGRFREAE